jgi:FAD/FMN-containing dehydrogenase
VGGSVPVFDEIILSLQLMNNVISIDPVAGVLVCEAGCILEQLDEQLAEQGLVMPLDLGAKGSCQIGGNISTNAGGIRLLRYGSLHGSVLGVEAVLASGKVINTLSSVRKDNVGYHLKHMFIGSEGTLGIVTSASVLCPRRPTSVNLALLGCDTFAQVLEIMNHARQHFNEILSAYEVVDRESMQCVLKHLKVATSPLLSNPAFYVLVETSGSHRGHDEEKLNAFLEVTMEKGIVKDGTIATDSSKIKKLWLLRESIAAGLLDDGYCYKYDISLPLDSYYDIVSVMRDRLKGLTTRVCGYGHVLDGNLHLNATSPHYDPRVINLIQPFLYEYIAARHGSISAEHGLGFMKNNYMKYGRTADSMELMMQTKCMMDPNGILNPYKTLPYLTKQKLK